MEPARMKQAGSSLLVLKLNLLVRSSNLHSPHTHLVAVGAHHVDALPLELLHPLRLAAVCGHTWAGADAGQA